MLNSDIIIKTQAIQISILQADYKTALQLADQLIDQALQSEIKEYAQCQHLQQ